jgi:hypothetical protein
MSKAIQHQMPYFARYFRQFLLFTVFLLFAGKGYASHVLGADLSYSWVSGNTYRIQMVIYGDCQSAILSSLPNATPRICIYQGSIFTDTIFLSVDAPVAGIEVTPPLCAGNPSQCSGLASLIPGVQLFTYSALYTLPTASAVWQFIFNGDLVISGCGRVGAVTNMGAGTIIHLEAQLNNSTAPNSSPVFHTVALPYYGINRTSYYNPAAVDLDGDSLSYFLVQALSASELCSPAGNVSYLFGTTASQPMQTLPDSFSFDNNTGQIRFYTDVAQRAVVVYNILQYHEGVFVGLTQREITILVTGDTDHNPFGAISAASNGVVTSASTIDVCDTMTHLSFHINPVDGDVTDNITMTAYGLPTGATFTIASNGTMHPTGDFSWDMTSTNHGLYTFFINYSDDHCPMGGVQTVAYTIHYVPCSALVTAPELPDRVNTMKISPDPSSGLFTIEMPQVVCDAPIVVTDMLGRIVHQQVMPAGGRKAMIDLVGMPPGSYCVKIVADGVVYREKIIVQQ